MAVEYNLFKSLLSNGHCILTINTRFVHVIKSKLVLEIILDLFLMQVRKHGYKYSIFEGFFTYFLVIQFLGFERMEKP